MTGLDATRAAADRRRHQLRIAVQTAAPTAGPPGKLVGQLAASLDSWTLERLSPDDEATWLVVGDVGVAVGTPAYARRAHSLVQRLIDTGAFRRVEADVPVTAYADEPEDDDRVRAHGGDDQLPGALAADDHLPGTEVKRWARDAIRCEQAWAVPPPGAGASRGQGAVVGHPDTGYTLHPRLGVSAVDRTRDWDAISGDDDAADPLVPPDRSPWPVPNPGHGTKTGSVIAGRGDEERGIVGVAPMAVLVPVRAVESVVQLFDSDVARSVDHARRVGCHVVSMSLGGKGFFGLRQAIQRAVDSGMIVMAAAGNTVGLVVAPASYDNCIAVAACGVGDRPWPGSSRGAAVDITAPGWSVHVASFSWRTAPPGRVVHRASGTSYAVAHLAGVAALWLAHHGVDTIRSRYGARRVQAVFLHQLRTAGRRVPPGWDSSRWGVGVVDAEALLEAPLPRPADVSDELRALGADESSIDRLSALVDVDREVLEQALAHRFGAEGAALDDVLGRYEGELAYLLLEDPTFRTSVLAGAPAGFSPPPVAPPEAASPDLVAALAGPFPVT